VQGARHRQVPGLLALELVAVAGDEQQGVVGAGAEDEHGQDAGRRLVPRGAGQLQDVGGDHDGEAVGHADDDEGHQPEHGAAVGQDQQDRHHGGGGGQQREVGAFEDLGQVGLDRRRARDLRGDPVRCGLGQLLAQVLDGGGGVAGGWGVQLEG
jgi:hypothetical protein